MNRVEEEDEDADEDEGSIVVVVVVVVAAGDMAVGSGVKNFGMVLMLLRDLYLDSQLF